MKKINRFSAKRASARIIRLSSDARSTLLSRQQNQKTNDSETFLACAIESMAEYDEALRGLIER
jgi:hypothetical protein